LINNSVALHSLKLIPAKSVAYLSFRVNHSSGRLFARVTWFVKPVSIVAAKGTFAHKILPIRTASTAD
jgi:hypothetical protein